MRTVLFHYHIFKNSGTTFDYAMQRKLGNLFLEFDVASGEKPILQTDLAKLITSHSNTLMFSSHTTRLPVPRVPGVVVEPVVFVRHPLLRLKSIYSWLNKTNLKTRLKSFVGLAKPSETDLARKYSLESHSFREWLHQLMETKEGRSHISNAQTRFLSGNYDMRPKRVSTFKKGGQLFNLELAKENLSQVNLLARTEYFDEDVAGFLPVLADMGIVVQDGFFNPKNVTNSDFRLPLQGRVASLRDEIGAELYASLEALMAQDLELYFWVGDMLEAGVSVPKTSPDPIL